jgi:hypothetical protein
MINFIITNKPCVERPNYPNSKAINFVRHDKIVI